MPMTYTIRHADENDLTQMAFIALESWQMKPVRHNYVADNGRQNFALTSWPTNPLLCDYGAVAGYCPLEEQERHHLADKLRLARRRGERDVRIIVAEDPAHDVKSWGTYEIKPDHLLLHEVYSVQQGAGSALVGYAKNAAQVLGVKKIELFMPHMVHAFFEKQGFTRTHKQVRPQNNHMVFTL